MILSKIKKINPKYILHELLTQIIVIQQLNKVVIQPLNNAEKLTINKIIKVLDSQFSFNYKIFGGSKLPVLAFYSLYDDLELKSVHKQKWIELLKELENDL